MTLTVRTDHRVSDALAQFCAQTKQTKSDVVKRALSEFLDRQALPKLTVWDSVKDLVLALELECASSDAPQPAMHARDRREHLSEYYAERHARRRRFADRAV